jgi:hypothetical protein
LNSTSYTFANFRSGYKLWLLNAEKLWLLFQGSFKVPMMRGSSPGRLSHRAPFRTYKSPDNYSENLDGKV